MRMAFLVLLLFSACIAPAAAQESPGNAAEPPMPSERPLRLFLDCQGTRCDFDYVRTQIQFVDFMRDRKEADVHLLVTSENTSAGGRRYTLNFIGLEAFDGIDDVLTYSTLQNDTEAMVRDAMVHTIKVGLVRYVAHTPQGADLRIAHRAPSEEGTAGSISTVRPEADPWHFWVFRVRLSGSMDGEERTNRYSTDGTFTANRTTEAWKFNFRGDIQYDEGRYTYSDGSTFLSVRRSWSHDALLVKSLTDHWSAGVRGELSSSTYYNQRLVAQVMPALEWNLFPYSQSTRRELTVQYAIGLHVYDYYQETIYGRLSDTLASHSVSASLDRKEPWGSTRTDVEFSQYLNQPSKYRLTARGQIDVRLAKGLSLNLNASASRIRNQIYLPKGDATEEEVLARQRQLATGHRYSFSVGISYTFGSIFNNIVNTRM
jgi:hypothetical protein